MTSRILFGEKKNSRYRYMEMVLVKNFRGYVTIKIITEVK